MKTKTKDTQYHGKWTFHNPAPETQQREKGSFTFPDPRKPIGENKELSKDCLHNKIIRMVKEGYECQVCGKVFNHPVIG